MTKLKLCRIALIRLMAIFAMISLFSLAPGYAQETEDSQIFISGFNAYQQQDYPTSISKLNEVLHKYPDTSLRDMSLFWLSRAYFKNGNEQDAARMLVQFSKEFPGNPLRDTVEEELSALVVRYQKGEKLATGPPVPQLEQLKTAWAKAAEEQRAAEKSEQEKLAKLKAEQEQAAAEAMRIGTVQKEQERLAAEKESARQVAQRREQEKQAVILAEQRKAEAEKQAAIRQEQEKQALILAEQQRTAEAEKQAAIRQEQEKQAAILAEQQQKAEAEKQAALKQEQEKQAALRAEQQRKAEAEKLAAIKLEQEKQAAILVEQQRKAEAEKLAAIKQEQEKQAAQAEQQRKAEAEKLAALKLEQEKQAAIQAEQQRKAEAEKLAAIKLEQERQAAIQAEQQRKAEAEKLAALKLEQEKQAAILAEQQRKAEIEKQAAIKQEQEKQAAIQAEQQRKAEAEKLAALKLEQEKQAAIQAEQQRKAEAEKLAALKQEQEKQAAIQAEQQRKAEADKLAAIKLEQEKQAAIQAEQQRKAEADKLAALKLEQEKQALLAERQRKAEADRLAALKLEQEKQAAMLAQQQRKAEADQQAALKLEQEKYAEILGEQQRKAEAAQMTAIRQEQEKQAVVLAEQQRKAEADKLAAIRQEQEKQAAVQAEELRQAKEREEEQARAAKAALREKAIAQFKAVIEKYPYTRSATVAAAKLKELGITVALPLEKPVSQPENAQILRLEVARFAGFEFNIPARPKTSEVARIVQIPFEIINRGNGADAFALESGFPAEFGARFAPASAPQQKLNQTPSLYPGEAFSGVLTLTIPPKSIDGLKIAYPVKAASLAMTEATQSRVVNLTAAAPMLRAVLKTDKTAPLPGEKLLYRIAVLNVGSTTANDVSLILNIPPQLQLAQGDKSGFRQEANDTIVLDGLRIKSGENREIALTLQLKPDALAGQELFVLADLLNKTLKTSAAFVSNTSLIQPQRNVVVRTAVGKKIVIPGQTVQIPFVVANTGNIRDSFKILTGGKGVTGVSVSHDRNRDSIKQLNEPGITGVGPLEPGEEAAILMEITTPVTAGDGADANSSITFISEGDPKKSSAVVTEIVYSRPVLSMAMTGKDVQLKPGEITSFDLEITNRGSNLARVVELTSIWPEQLELVGAEPVNSSSDSGKVIWNFREVGAGEKKSIRVSFRVRAGIGFGTNIQVKNILKYEDQIGNRY